MKNSFILFLLAFCTTAQLASAQPAATPRVSPVQTQLDLQKGELDHFKNMLFRLETAVEEQDQENTDVLRQVLLDLVKKEVASTKTASDAFAKKLPEMYQALMAYQFPVHAVGSDDFKVKMALFQDMVDWKTERIAALENGK